MQTEKSKKGSLKRMVEDDIETLNEHLRTNEPISDYSPLRRITERFRNTKIEKSLLEHTEIVPTAYVYDILSKRFYLHERYFEITDALRLLTKLENLFEEIRRTYLRWLYKKTEAQIISEARESLITALMPYQKHNGNKKPKTKLELQKAMLPWQLKNPKIVSWDEMYKMHVDNFAAYEQKTVAPKTPRTTRVQPPKPASEAPPSNVPKKFVITGQLDPRTLGPKEVSTADLMNGAPWKTKAKIKDFAKRNQWEYEQLLQDHAKHSADIFEMKKQRKLMKHWAGPRYTFVIDYMFAGHNKEGTKWGYLLAINVNTRKAFWALPSKIRKVGAKYTVQKNLNENMAGAIESLKEIMKQTPVKHLLSDQEKAFGSQFQQFLKENGISHRFYVKNNVSDIMETNEKSRGNHSFTSLVDRLIRTLRTMAYLLTRKEEIDPKLMEYLVDEYNNSPHSTLSKYIRRPVSPNEVDANLELEEQVVKCVLAANFEAELSTPKLSKYVRVYNDAHSWDKVKPKLLPGWFEVVGKEGGLVILKQGKTILKVNRWMIVDDIS